ncbi:hypothetical protein [Nocardioides pantholopis]|uniref:hypothetical protein n=1 Tax=Nocardioides pantholopis TaxID=2483798 RepID=UPI0013E381B6|nr:hypothetical protein [Nocardioides pantholopis]
MLRTALRTHATKILASVVLVSGAAGVAGLGTFGAFTDTTSADVEVSSAKRVDVLMNGTGDGLTVDAKGLIPGDTRLVALTLERPGDTAELSALTAVGTATGDSTLVDALKLDVQACSQPWTTTATTMTCGAKSSPVVVGSPVIGTSPRNWGPLGSWVNTLNTGGKVHLRVSLELPDTAVGHNAQGHAAALHYELRGEQRTGTAKVVPTTTVAR